MMLDEQDNIRIFILGCVFECPMPDPNIQNLVTDVLGNNVQRLIKAQGQGGKWEYMAKEVAMRHDCFDGFAIDLWAMAIVLFEFLVGKKPFAMPDAVDKNFYTIAIEGNLEGLTRTAIADGGELIVTFSEDTQIYELILKVAYVGMPLIMEVMEKDADLKRN
eukprot:CCRYP_000956-RA/>CCRYP_000956-RA protein AED:0.31 eAED:0.31 QI:0/0/0/0.5/1/1/2/0/161